MLYTHCIHGACSLQMALRRANLLTKQQLDKQHALEREELLSGGANLHLRQKQLCS